jgi:predicted RNase H-like HicB family nuclease
MNKTIFNRVLMNPNKMKIEIVVLLYKDGDYHMAYCPALELSSYGKTESEAKEYFLDALNIFIEDTIKKGTLEKCLLKFGWSLQQIPNVKYEPPRIENSIENISKYDSPKFIKEQFAVPVY